MLTTDPDVTPINQGTVTATEKGIVATGTASLYGKRKAGSHTHTYAGALSRLQSQGTRLWHCRIAQKEVCLGA